MAEEEKNRELPKRETVEISTETLTALKRIMTKQGLLSVDGAIKYLCFMARA